MRLISDWVRKAGSKPQPQVEFRGACYADLLREALSTGESERFFLKPGPAPPGPASRRAAR